MTPPPEPTTRLDIEGTFNFREVAPGILRPGRLYRSDALHRLTPRGRASMSALGITRVIDLRSQLDRRLSGRDRLRGLPVEYLRIPIAGAGPRVDPAVITLAGVYRTVLGDHGPQMGLAIRAIADAPGPVLVHCTAGKDRTGLVVALTLLALGVEYDAVAADFSASAANLAGEWSERMLRRARRYRVVVTDGLLEVMAGSPETALRGALAYIDDEHGGLPAYLERIGVDQDAVSRLHGRLDRR